MVVEDRAAAVVEVRAAVVEVTAAAEVLGATRVVETWETVAETVLGTEAELTLEEAAPLKSRREEVGEKKGCRGRSALRSTLVPPRPLFASLLPTFESRGNRTHAQVVRPEGLAPTVT